MDWISGLNSALGYIERRLDGELDQEEICRLTACPMNVFQRFFMLATGITLTEYIRRRRLSCAARELQSTGARVIDIALKYGYESPDAFYVAFKRMFGMPPTAARRSKARLKLQYRIFFTLSITYIKGEGEMVIQNVDKYRVTEPLFEGFRVILSLLGEKYTPDYIQGISGAAFKIAGGCPSRPTCITSMWTTDLVRLLGYEAAEYPCADGDGKDVTEEMIHAVRRSVDGGRPALVWNAFTNLEWDVVCGYDEEQRQFIGRGSYFQSDDYTRDAWDRAARSEGGLAFGAIVVGAKTGVFDARKAELASLLDAVNHARTVTPPEDCIAGIQFYRKWAEEYAREGRARDVADAYCHQIYSSVRKCAAGYLREIAPGYGRAAGDALREAAGWFEREAARLEDAAPYLSWGSPWGVDEARSKKVAPLLSDAAGFYEKAVECLEQAILHIKRE